MISPPPLFRFLGRIGETIVEVIDQKNVSIVEPRSSFSDRGLSHQTFNQVIDTRIWLVVGSRSSVLGNQRLLVLN